ncbi:DegT/DnrJ/EryC1/StrS aminotransferase family protein [bacterium]|nr:DegT/DnrJ/EryC1/StrS aminotransferase family protein [bacterium]
MDKTDDLKPKALKYPVYQPSLTGNEKKYVNECLDSTWISSKGKFLGEFEEKFAKFIGTDYATSVCNGTVAVHLALLALGIGEGDEVIVPTFTYIASANPVLVVNAKPVFVDSLEDTWQMSPKDIEAKITEKTKAIIVVHLYGHPCDMDEIMRIAKEHDLYVIEDCAEAIGTKYKGQTVGSFGDIGCFSFFGNKTMTCGEGGMVVTSDATLADRLRRYKNQGNAKYREYWNDILGFNYRMTNIQAAIGLAQLEQVEHFINKKRQIANWYMEKLKDLPLEFNKEGENMFHTYWMVSCLVEKAGMRDKLREYLKINGIETRPTFYPIHTMPVYVHEFSKHKVAENIALRGMNLPSYPALEHDDVIEICSVIRKFFEEK